jgi:ribosome-binding protein aMBF1 (putative translation factor)
VAAEEAISRQDPFGGVLLRVLLPTVGFMPDLGAVVARNVRAERARHGWRQRELAEAMGWSIGMVSDTESGQRRIGIEDMPKLCRALGVPLIELLKGATPEDLAALDVP